MRRTASVLALLLLTVSLAPAAAAAPIRPKDDPFYRYDGATPLAQVAPGTVLKSRDVTLGLSTNPTPVPATQLLYRTADETGQPTVTVTTVVAPPGSTVAPKLVAYLSFYDSLSDKCNPSYTLTGGDPGADNAQLTEVEQALVSQYQALGWVVTVPDFEGTDLHWTAGHEAGYGTLDAIRATKNFLKLGAATPVGLSGYSGGSIASDWASEMAPAYAPEINLVGVAEGGVPVHFAHNLTYINGSDVWSGIIPAVLVALSRAFGLDLDTYLSPLGKQLTAKVQDQCIGEFSGTTPGLKVEQLLKPQYADFLKVPAFVEIVNKLIMGTEPGHPKGPLLMQVGNDPANAQGQGDDIMVTEDVRALAYEYCTQGVPVQFKVLANANHTNAALLFEPQATAFLAERFAGVPFVADSCASIGKGSDISPVTLDEPSASPSPAASAAPVPPVAAGPGLAVTGGVPAVALLSLVLLGTAYGVRRRRA